LKGKFGRHGNRGSGSPWRPVVARLRLGVSCGRAGYVSGKGFRTAWV